MTSQQKEIGWKHDLPKLDKASEPSKYINQAYPPPDHIDTVYIEFPRSTLKIRGLAIIGFGIALLLLSANLIRTLTDDWFWRDLERAFFITAFSLLAYFLITPYIRIDIELPRNEPIRFNRARKKVYFYQYRYDRLNPLGRKNWGIKPVAYNWDNITAEVYRLGYGGDRHESIRLSIHDPITDKIIDRVYFSGNIEEGKKCWEVVQLFMQKGPEALPEFIYAANDWSKEPSNPFERIAPKVQWPIEMDLESRTAPSPGEHP
ncbi:DUF6708 domain-containing protein [Pseudomonas sp. PSKL.D1]|uniref:DUF6708 domain-containing protein n=1 Tax=Pseudomonas sp. PSKL.D1 TaxID=3029060 RepID=UPI0023817424|nr:DUF6708 domain-containing protein [Pseudomonas sp. PSKL.D1]WDY56610.1 hypothetical protein PVV54_18730 [Pseudomonas sp. PSKL.D1]